jgi:hypothetical protein
VQILEKYPANIRNQLRRPEVAEELGVATIKLDM